MEMRQLRNGDLRWVYPNPRHMLLLKEQSLIPKRLSIYIPRVVCELKLTVDLNHCDQLSELSTTITTLPAHFDRMGVSLEIIDKPSTKVFSDSNDATTIEKFANDLKVIRKNLVFKQLDYRGSDHLSDQAKTGLAYLFKRTHTLKLWDATVDLSEFALDEPTPLKDLALDYSFFKPHNQFKGHQIRLESFKAIKSQWNPKFGDLTNISTLRSLEIIEPEDEDFLRALLEDYGTQLSSLQAFHYNCRRDKQIHSMQYLLPRVSKLEKIAFASKTTSYRRDSQKRNIYNSVYLSHLLDM